MVSKKTSHICLEYHCDIIVKNCVPSGETSNHQPNSSKRSNWPWKWWEIHQAITPGKAPKAPSWLCPGWLETVDLFLLSNPPNIYCKKIYKGYDSSKISVIIQYYLYNSRIILPLPCFSSVVLIYRCVIFIFWLADLNIFRCAFFCTSLLQRLAHQLLVEHEWRTYGLDALLLDPLLDWWLSRDSTKFLHMVDYVSMMSCSCIMNRMTILRYKFYV